MNALDKIKRHLIDNKDLYGAVSALVTTLAAIVFGFSTIITAGTANRLLSQQTSLAEADQLPVITVRFKEINYNHIDFGQALTRVEVYNKGGPIKSYSVNMSVKFIIFFLKKDLKGKPLGGSGGTFEVSNYTDYPTTPSGDSELISFVDASNGPKRLDNLYATLIKYGIDNLEYSTVGFIPHYCVGIKYIDKFNKKHIEEKCTEGWSDLDEPMFARSFKESNYPAIDLTSSINPKRIHMDYLKFAYSNQLKEMMRKQATEIIKLDTTPKSGLEPIP